jgi:hypothetical protein
MPGPNVSANCNCRCLPPYPDCFGCLVFNPNDGDITDATADIGTTITWTSVEDDTCSVSRANYEGGLNCDLWGPIVPAVVCGTLLSSGSSEVEYHSVSPAYLSGTPTLQRSTSGLCRWRKRRVKLLQGLYHHSAYKHSAGAFLANYCSEHISVVTYPYTDPVDAADQWAPIVYPKPYMIGYTPVIDTRCGTKIDAAFASDTSTASNTWQCYDSYIETTLELDIINLSVYPGVGIYACRAGQTVQDELAGTPHWQLSLKIKRAFAAASCLTIASGFPPIGRKTGTATPYFQTGQVNDPRNPDLDLLACPPYSKIGAGTYCGNSDDTNLLQPTDPTVLRWTKEVDCDNDFLGNPLSLTLDAPRRFIDATGAHCECATYGLNATKLGITGYNTTATVNLLYV